MTSDVDTFAEASVTATVCENATLCGAMPERGEFDNRNIQDRDNPSAW